MTFVQIKKNEVHAMRISEKKRPTLTKKPETNKPEKKSEAPKNRKSEEKWKRVDDSKISREAREKAGPTPTLTATPAPAARKKRRASVPMRKRSHPRGRRWWKRAWSRSWSP